MNNLIKVISSSITAGKRIIKFFRFGVSDIQTAFEYSPFGVDSNPIKDMVAIYAPTSDNGETVIIGYLNKNQKAASGELRIFATDDSGTEKFYVWLKKTGVIEIGGDTNFAVKFNELKAEFNKLKTDYNGHITEYNLHTHLGVTVGSGSTGVTTPSTKTNTSNIDNAKNDKIKTI